MTRVGRALWRLSPCVTGCVLKKINFFVKDGNFYKNLPYFKILVLSGSGGQNPGGGGAGGGAGPQAGAPAAAAAAGEASVSPKCSVCSRCWGEFFLSK